MRTVFLDTVGLLALWDEADQWHASAEAAMDKLLRRPCRKITTSFVMLECGNAACRTPYRSAVAQLREELLRYGNLIAPSTADEQRAWAAYVNGEASQAGIVDHVSFVVMKRLGITEAFTHDRHFRVAGLEPGYFIRMGVARLARWP